MTVKTLNSDEETLTYIHKLKCWTDSFSFTTMQHLKPAVTSC